MSPGSPSTDRLPHLRSDHGTGSVEALVALDIRIHVKTGINNYRQRRFLFAGALDPLEALETVLVRQRARPPHRHSDEVVEQAATYDNDLR